MSASGVPRAGLESEVTSFIVAPVASATTIRNIPPRPPRRAGTLQPEPLSGGAPSRPWCHSYGAARASDLRNFLHFAPDARAGQPLLPERAVMLATNGSEAVTLRT
jgi:hypothetical protein